MNLPPYQFFGSQDSIDIDVVFFVEQIPESISQSAKIILQYTQQLAELHRFTKPINGNLVVLGQGHLRNVFKGTIDELNNSLLHTYDLHQQYFENKIQVLLKRDVNLKFLRSTRVILSYFTKTSARKVVKSALQGDIDLKYEALRNLDLIALLENEVQSSDVLKSIAFQIGQTLALDEGMELFTKMAIASHFPTLTSYLYRESLGDYSSLFEVLQVFLSKLDERRKMMQNKFEYMYQL